jgi:hypothetical protein
MASNGAVRQRDGAVAIITTPGPELRGLFLFVGNPIDRARRSLISSLAVNCAHGARGLCVAAYQSGYDCAVAGPRPDRPVAKSAEGKSM